MAFNPEQFMNSASEPMATQMQVIPEGEYPFMIDSDPKGITVEHLSGVSKRTGNPYDFHQMEINCICVDAAVKQKLNREKITCRLRVNLDLDASGSLEVGADKNVGLGRLRDALNQNKPGWKPADLRGAGPFIGKVEHNNVNGATYADITRVAKVS